MKITNVNNVTWTTTFIAHLNTCLHPFFIKRRNESFPVSTRCCQTVSGSCKSLCSAMIGGCSKWTVLMNAPESNLWHWGRRKFNLSAQRDVRSTLMFLYRHSLSVHNIITFKSLEENNFDYKGYVLSVEVPVVSLQKLVFPATTKFQPR